MESTIITNDRTNSGAPAFRSVFNGPSYVIIYLRYVLTIKTLLLIPSRHHLLIRPWLNILLLF